MTLSNLLNDHADEILRDALEGLQRAHLAHYDHVPTAENRTRLRELFEAVRQSVMDRDLGPIVRLADTIARDRFRSGYGLWEIQTAFNVIEESLWRHIVAKLEPSDLAEALGLVSTVHGAGKDRLARTYVELASHRPAANLNVSALFRGSEGT
jgi:hypothetical protein